MKRRCMITLFDKKISETKSGFEKWNITEGRNIEARVASVSRDEFYKACASGMKPSAQFSIHPSDYAGEKFLTHEDKRYRVIRTYEKTMREIVLVCKGDEPNDA